MTHTAPTTAYTISTTRSARTGLWTGWVCEVAGNWRPLVDSTDGHRTRSDARAAAQAIVDDLTATR